MKQLKDYFKQLYNSRILSRLWLPAVLLSLLPVFTDYLANRSQVSVIDLLVMGIVNVLISIIVCLVFAKVWQRQPLTGLLAALLTTNFLTNHYEDRLSAVYQFLKALNPINGLGVTEEIWLSLVWIIILGLIGYGLALLVVGLLKRLPFDQLRLTNALIVLVSVAFVLQALPVFYTTLSAWPQYFYRPTNDLGKLQAAGDKPDIYYIVLDRYTNQTTLKNQFHFDNSDFINFLTDNQYTVKPKAFSNYPYTTMSISSTLLANYHNQIIQRFGRAVQQVVEPYHQSIRYAPVAQALKPIGYSFYHVGSWYEASNYSPLATKLYQGDERLTLFNHLFIVSSFTKAELGQSPLSRFLYRGLRIGKLTVVKYETLSGQDMITSQLDSLGNIAQQSSGGHLVFAHLLIPHEPYYFNADGSLSTTPNSDNVGQPIQQKYLGQVQFINSRMKTILADINEKTHGQAVVVLQSDEGPYPMQLLGQDFDLTHVGQEVAVGDMRNWSDQSLKFKYGILAAYHIPKASAEEIVKAGDSVNIFRLILNTYFGAKLEYLPNCYYAYSDGRNKPFAYVDITSRLTGQANAACPSDSNFIKK